MTKWVNHTVETRSKKFLITNNICNTADCYHGTWNYYGQLNQQHARHSAHVFSPKSQHFLNNVACEGG